MTLLIICLVAFFSGMAASLGLGGGFVLLIYLTIFTDIPQLQAQGINLLFFLPIGLLSLCLHARNHLIEKKPLIPSVMFGIIGVLIGIFLTDLLPSQWLSKVFAVFIIFIGIKEIFHKKNR